MPELAAVGLKTSEEIDVEPVIVPVAGYVIETGKEVIEKFPFKPSLPVGVVALLERNGGQTNLNQALLILNNLITPDAAERWTAFIERPDLAVEAETIAELAKALIEHYGQRPTRPSSGSSRTGRRTARTSKAAPASEE